MKSSVEHLNDTRVKLTVEVPFDEMKPEFDQAYEAIAQQISIPGFRKGKAPRKLIEARVGRGPILEQVLGEVLPSRYDQAIEEHKLVVLGAPTWDVSKVEDGEFIEFVAETEVRPAITVPDFSEIKVEVPAVEIADEDIEAKLEVLRQRFASLVDVEDPERTAHQGDFVTVDYQGLQGGEPISSDGYASISFEVGEFADNEDAEMVRQVLDRNVVGMAVGEQKYVVAVPEVSGVDAKEIGFDVKLTHLQERKLPEVDDEFAQLASEFDTVAELRESIVSGLKEEAMASQATDARDAVLKAALDAVDFPLPEGFVQAQIDGQVQQLIAQLGGSEAGLNRMLSAQDTTREEFDQRTRESAEEAVRTQLFLDALADQVEPHVSQAEFTEHIIATAQSYGMEPMQFVKYLEQNGHIANIFADIRRGKALASVICDATITDSNGEEVDVKPFFIFDEEVLAETADAAESAETTE